MDQTNRAPSATPTPEALADLATRLGRDQVFGSPVQAGGVLLLPVATVRAGGGMRSATTGGSGVQARALGAFSISADGCTHWHPAVDVNRIVLGGQVALGLVGLVLALRRYRRH